MKLPVISGLEVVRRLKKAGFVATRQKGSHLRMEKYADGKPLKLTVPLHQEMKKGTLLHIIKEAHLTSDKFEELR